MRDVTGEDCIAMLGKGRDPCFHEGSSDGNREKGWHLRASEQDEEGEKAEVWS